MLVAVAGLARNGELIDYDPEDMKAVCSKYKLTGIVVHSGQASGGHYYSYILHRLVMGSSLVSLLAIMLNICFGDKFF